MKFEKVSKYNDADIVMPVRKTEASAGYDLCAAEDYIIPSAWQMIEEAKSIWPISEDEYISMNKMAEFAKNTQFKPILVSTGVKCQLDSDKYLQLSVRSSLPLKHWLVLANGVGIIDSDYYNNEDNEGEIFLQLFNFSPYNMMIPKGTAIGQGIILPYDVVEDDAAAGTRTGGFGSTGYSYEQKED